MEPKHCPNCHAAIPVNAPGGFCPACLLRGAEDAPTHRPAAPSLEEIAAAFPQWEVLGLIGQGGMGFVYKVRQPNLDRVVALKILSPELSRDPAFAERFSREARTLGKLNHPNIVTVFEHGQVDAASSVHEAGAMGRMPLYYLTMEYVDGVNLRQAMRAGRFTPQQALAIVPGICDALQYAHEAGVWHRDIKPENILLDRDGKVKIADFGIARMIGDPQRDFTLTMTGAALGSAAYMAPEQHEKPHDVDHRADIYSLGVVIYEMLTGELPLGRFPSPSQRSAVDVRIDEIVFKTLEKERELRQQSATEVKTDLQRARHGPIRPMLHDAAIGLGRLKGLIGCAIAFLVIAFVLGSPRWRFASETAQDISQLVFGLSILSSAICGILAIYLSRPGRVVAILGIALLGLVLLLVMEARGSLRIALMVSTMIGVGAAGLLFFENPRRKDGIGAKDHAPRRVDAMHGFGIGGSSRFRFLLAAGLIAGGVFLVLTSYGIGMDVSDKTGAMILSIFGRLLVISGIVMAVFATYLRKPQAWVAGLGVFITVVIVFVLGSGFFNLLMSLGLLVVAGLLATVGFLAEKTAASPSEGHSAGASVPPQNP